MHVVQRLAAAGLMLLVADLAYSAGKMVYLDEPNLYSWNPANSTDIRALYDLLKRHSPKKDSFETEPQYLNRVQEAIGSKLGPAVNQSYVFVIDPKTNKSGITGVRYSPEERSWLVEFYQAPKLYIHSKDKERRTYIGTNSFGAAVEVQSISRDRYGLNVRNAEVISEPKYKTGLPSLEFRFPLETELARAYGEHPYVGLVIKLIAPFTSEDSDYVQPTIDAPVEIVSSDYLVEANLEEIWLISRRDGTIFARKKWVQ